MIFSSTGTPARQVEIDLLRIIAALIVFVYHYTDSFNFFSNIVPGNLFIGQYLRYGYMGVMLFFVISGYVVTMSTMKKNISEFITSRIVRLYPVFWLSCIIAALLPRVFPHVHPYLPYPSIKAFLLNLTMVPTAFRTVMINPVFWSLLEEVHFYLIISLIITFKLWPKVLSVISIWIGIYAFQLLLGWGRSDEQIGILVPKHSLYFIAGILFYLLQCKQFTQWKVTVLLIVTFLLTIPVARNLADFTNRFYTGPHMVSFFGYIIINSTIFAIFWLIAEKRFSIKSNKIIMKLGDLTYPFYLIHLYGLGLYWYLRDKVQSQLLLLIILVLASGASYLINRFYEKPLTRFIKKLKYKSVGVTDIKASNNDQPIMEIDADSSTKVTGSF